MSGQEKNDALELHSKNPGKIDTENSVDIKTQEDLEKVYTPGVAEPCKEIADDPDKSFKYTSRRSMVGVVSDGSAVLGLGDIGGEAAMPVMEGKCNLLNKFAGVNAFPLVTNKDKAESIINFVESAAPTFGAINLEDISAPKCFEIEDRLKDSLDIPVFHDDQHGTAITVRAALNNSADAVGKNVENMKITVLGVGAAGKAVCEFLHRSGCKNILPVDKNGVVSTSSSQKHHREIASLVEPEGCSTLEEAMEDSDAFIGLSAGNILDQEHIELMSDNPIVFALANPEPEIRPKEAKEAGAAVTATGRSDFTNQVNNSLAFPGIFRAVTSEGINKIGFKIKDAASEAIQQQVQDPEPGNIVPESLDSELAQAVSDRIIQRIGRTAQQEKEGRKQ
jgi:malate dehydrogenase (oxaloacetate-decarboxylating)